MRTGFLPNRLLLVVLVAATILVVLPPCAVLADGGDSDPLEGLTDEEKAYVNGLRGSYAAARSAVNELSGELGGAALGALFGAAPPDPIELAGKIMACNGKLSGLAPAFHKAPPGSMQSLTPTNEAVAACLEYSFYTCADIVYEEGKNLVLDTGRNWLCNALGVPPPPPDKPRPSLKARVTACVLGEIGTLNGVLDAGEIALNAKIEEIQAEQAAGAAILEAFLFDDCFIATAAYGTKSAAEIDVLRDFRDEVLMQSAAGRELVDCYYACSPPVADFIARHDALRTVVRGGFVDPIVHLVSLVEPLWSAS